MLTKIQSMKETKKLRQKRSSNAFNQSHLEVNRMGSSAVQGHNVIINKKSNNNQSVQKKEKTKKNKSKFKSYPLV